MLTLVALVTGCAATTHHNDMTNPTPAPSGAISDLPVQRVSTATPTRVAEGLAPPTNKWFSSLAFGADPLPVFPFPLAFGPSLKGFSVQLPTVVASATTIAAPLTADALGVDLGATSFVVTAYDSVAVTIQYSDAQGPLVDVTIAEGSPIVAVRAQRDTSLGLSTALTADADGQWSAAVAGVTYGIAAPGASAQGSTLTLKKDAAAQIFAVPSDSTPQDWFAAVGAPITSVASSFAEASDTVTTTLTYQGTDKTVLVPFGGHELSSDIAKTCTLGTFTTAYGPAPACAATALTWSIARITPADSYDFDGLDKAARAKITDQLNADAASFPAIPADTYYGGKALARLGSMLTLARSLGDTSVAKTVADRLSTELSPWLEAGGCKDRDAHCFVYDDVLHLVVGKTPSFGSEDGNDHHFHYGYFFSAAAALAQERPQLIPAMTPVLTALAADVATGAQGAAAPLRVFDPYRGHSWAAGMSPFADGNNQESSSEAVAAWNGLAMWAKVSKNAELERLATWLLSAEADAATRLWLEPNLDGIPAGFQHSIVSLNWGGKRDYATWFSAEPSAILGIQLLPFSPVSLEYLGKDPARVKTNVDGAGAAAFTGALGDYVLLYSALAGPDAQAQAQKTFDAIPSADLDDGLSSSAGLAWLAAVKLRQ